MGYPVNHRTVIDLLIRSKNSNTELNNWQKQAVQILEKRIRQYSLFAVILHNPARHQSFYTAITERFHEFNLPNPTNLLFFTLEDPPSSFKEYYQKESREFSSPDLYKMLSGPGPKFSLQNAVSYSNHFDFLLFSAGIQIEDKPIVILSKDLFGTEFYWFETDEYSLPGQLAALSIVAKELSEGLSSFESAKHRIYNGVKEGSVYGSIGAFSFIENLEILLMLPGNELETVSYLHSKRYEDYLSRLRSDAEQLENNSKEAESMGDESSVELDKLTDVLSYLVKYLPNHITQFDLRAEPLYCKISILNHSFKSSFEPLPKTVQSLFDGLFTRLLKKVARKIDNYTDGQNEISKTNQNYYDQLKEVLEPVSFSYLRTSFLLYNSIMSGRYGKKEETDISLVAVGIGKTIENEINLSIIHYLRLKLGIELPAFFNRFQYGKIGQFYDEGPPEFIIQLNKQKKNHIMKNYDWLGPSLGTSSMATGIISDEPELAEIHEFFPNGNLNKLLELIEVLPSVRNAGGHPYTSITNKDIEKMFKMVWDLLEAGIFHDMKQLRLKLSTNKGEFYGLH